MSGLYKRYIPPKAVESANASVATPPNVQTTTARVAPVHNSEAEKKRKRERSEDQIAERKAKKLRKKGIDPATVPIVVAEQTKHAATTVVRPAPATPTAEPTEDEIKAIHAAAEARGDFSHITNIKKRHKLEAQARKAGLRVAGKIGASKHQKDVAEAETEPQTQESQPVPVREEVHGGPQSEKEETLAQEEATAATAGTPSQVHRKRRHRLEDVIAEGIESTDLQDKNDENVDQRLAKHTNVLGKFKKSAKRSPVLEAGEPEVGGPRLETVDRLELPDATAEEFNPDEESELPEWLRKPLIVDSRASKKSWTELNLDAATSDRLTKLSFDGAMPIQQALVPLLMPPGLPGAAYFPGSEKHLPDVVVSAPTGSGKTISYLLPIIEALRQKGPVAAVAGNLSAVILVPTQELVTQVAAVAESLCNGSDVKIGQSNSKHGLREEQRKIVRQGHKYDPAGFKRYMDIADHGQLKNCPSDARSLEYTAWLEASQPDPQTAQLIETMLEPSWLAGFTPTYESLVDILVITPQRLHDHIEETEGFSLDNLSWLVLDEADRMLDNQHRDFLEMLRQETFREIHVYKDFSGQKLSAPEPPRLRKVVLSATIPKDVKVEHAFQLRFPKLVVERGVEAQAESGAQAYASRPSAEGNSKPAVELLELRSTLAEYVIPVGDGSEKPLIAVELLQSRILKKASATLRQSLETTTGDAGAFDSPSEAERDDISTTSSDSDSDYSLGGLTSAATSAPTVLIFTSSTESAHRLTHLLSAIMHHWEPYITNIVKQKSRRKALKSTDPAIVISTDRAARGLDGYQNRMFTHVIQYDVPRSVIDYVHRVGRTARAGRSGQAWTLFTTSEAGWFKREIVRSERLMRSVGVEEVKVERATEDMREAYSRVLAEMREVVEGGVRKE